MNTTGLKLNAKIESTIGILCFKIFIAIFWIALSLLLFIFFKKSLFFSNIPKYINAWTWIRYRLIWCVICGGFGMAFRAILMINGRGYFLSLSKDYFFAYPIFLIVNCCLIFSLLHIFDQTKNEIFYPFSFALCFIIGFDIYKMRDLAIRLINKMEYRLK